MATACALNVLTKGLIGLVFPIGAIGLYLLLTGNLRLPAEAAPGFERDRVLRGRGALAHSGGLAKSRAGECSQASCGSTLSMSTSDAFWVRGCRVTTTKCRYCCFGRCSFCGSFHGRFSFRSRCGKYLGAGAISARQMTRRQRAYLLSFLWIIVIVGFFSLSTRQEYYTIPAIPGMALLVGGWLQRERTSAADSRERRAGRASSAILLAVGAVIAVAGFSLLIFSKAPAPGTDLADLLRKHPQDYALSFGHFLDLTPQAMGVFRVPLLAFSLAFLLGTAANFVLRRRGQAGPGNIALVAMMVVVLTCVRVAFGIFSPILSSKDLALAIQQQYRPGDQIVVIGLYENASTLNFYTGIPLRSLRTPGGNMWYGTQFPGAPRVFETPASFRAMWNGPGRVFLWAEEDDPAELNGLARYEVARRGGKIIFSNQASPSKSTTVATPPS